MSDADREKKIIGSVGKQLYIGGRWVEPAAGKTFPVEDPSTGEALCEVADGGPDDAVKALDAACAVQDEWAATAPRERGEVLRRAFDLLAQRADDLALLMTLEMGKSLAESKAEVIYAAEFFRWFSEEAVRIDGGYTVAANGSGRTLVMRQPVGPSILITPWNFPLAMGTRKVGPAIAAGCTIVMKPAGLTPLSMLALAQVLEEAGLPGGVFNVVTTNSSGSTMAPVIADRRARKLSFTGSTPVGQKLMEQAAGNVLRVSMELGGNAPLIVFEDADIEHAVEQTAVAKMRNIGQSCVAANRIFVHESIAEDFSSRLADRLGSMKVGRGTEEGTEVGPLIDENQRSKVASLVDDATAKGAKAVRGGSKVQGPGYFFEPTVLTSIPEDADLLRDEIFGPVAPVITFADEEDAVTKANDTEYGLVAYVFSENIRRALRVTERLETGMVGLNRGMVSNPAAPFGGVKHSGVGREGGREGIQEFLEVKHVAVDL